MKLSKNILLFFTFSLITSSFVPAIAIKVDQDSNCSGCKLKKVVRSNWFKAGVGIVAVGAFGGGVIWALRKRMAAFQKTQSCPTQQSTVNTTTSLDTIEMSDIYQIISPGLSPGKDSELLRYSVKRKGFQKPLFSNHTLNKDWEGYSACYKVFDTSNKEKYFKVHVFYTEYDRINQFINAMKNLLDSKNIPMDTRDCDVNWASYTATDGQFLYSNIL